MQQYRTPTYKLQIVLKEYQVMSDLSVSFIYMVMIL